MLNQDMDTFVAIIISFPTAIFTFMLGLSVLFWFVSLLGFFDLDGISPDVDLGDGSLDIGVDGTDNILTGLLLKLRLNGVPVTLTFTFISLFAWIFCYYAVYFFWDFLPFIWLRYLLGLILLFSSFSVSVFISAKLLRPLRRFFVQHSPSTVELLGQTVIVRSSRADSGFGEAEAKINGASLLIQIRARGSEVFAHGERVVIIERT